MPPWRRPLAAIAVVVAGGVLVAAWLLLPVQAWIAAASSAIAGLGMWGPVAYAVAYALALVVLAPGGPLSIGAGLAFGFWGVPVVLAGATTGAALAFLVSRHLLRSRVRQVIDRRPTLAAVDRAVADEGWRIVGLLRLSPLVPFNLQNYFFGVTQVAFWPYVAATAVGIAPGAVLYVWLGIVGRTSGTAEAGPAKWALVAAGLVATLAVALLIGRKARAMLADRGVAAPAAAGRQA